MTDRLAARRFEDARHLAVAGTLLTGVAATLLLGWMLAVVPPGPPATPAPVAAPVDEPPAFARPTALPAAPSEAAKPNSAGEFTLQFLVTCDRAKVARLRAELGGDERFAVRPVTHDGRACSRILWGVFGTREEALAAAPPAALTALSATPVAKSLDELAP